ncbi:MAG TPA: Rieske (2Fe-2S) protein [Capsulimonadaceae bacterium]|jgi:Rieske Fe-S protein
MSDAAKGQGWRKDFPIEWDSDNYITRREFTKFLVLTSAATCVGNGVLALGTRRDNRELPSVTVLPDADLKPGDVHLFRYPTDNDPAILVRNADGALAGYMQRCTHLSCPVQYKGSSHTLECPCHNGSFDAASGKVISGPPPRPLPRIRLEVRDGHIHAIGLEDEA